MANTVKGATTTARRALIEAAKALLSDRVPSAVTGRELAQHAGVNYGLVHHYFGSKEAVFLEALLELRDEFVRTHDRELPELLLEPDNPYLRALGRSQIDASDDLRDVGDHPVGDAVVAALERRLGSTHPAWSAGEVRVEAQARALAMLSLQVGYGIYFEMLDDAVGVQPDQRDDVTTALRRLYRDLRLDADTTLSG